MIFRARWSAWALWTAAVGLAVVGYALIPTGAVSAVLNAAIGTSVAVAVVVGVRMHHPGRPGLWYFLAASQLAMVIGDALTASYRYAFGDESSPSLADASYLLFYPLSAAGLFILIRGRTAGRDRAGLLDALTISTGMALLSWVFLVHPMADDLSNDVFARLVALAYPVGDILLLAMLARVLVTPGVRTVSYWMLVVAVALALVVGVCHTAFNPTDPYSAGVLYPAWRLAYLCLGTAALHPSMRSLSQSAPDRAPRITRVRLAVLAGASLLAPGVLAWQGATHRQIDWLAVTLGSVALFLLVVARISGLVTQVQDQAARLAALAHNDGLTAIPNRRAWDLELPREMARSRRDRMPVSIALLDIDHFKRYNDRYGHQAGDGLLKEAVAAWSAQLRPGDLLARYGGEEFGVILPGLTAEYAVEVIDRLRQATPLEQTISAGVACWDGVESPEQLTARADTALYQAKHAGRNQVSAGGTDLVHAA